HPAEQGDVRAGVIAWSVGVNQAAGPEGLVETILPAIDDGRQVWRVVHRDADPTAPDGAASYDLYDVDRESLNPLRSVMQRPEMSLRLTFDAGRVTIETRDEHGDRREEIAVRDPRPEGPGLTVYLGSLPLRAGYRTRFRVIDRW